MSLLRGIGAVVLGLGLIGCTSISATPQPSVATATPSALPSVAPSPVEPTASSFVPPSVDLPTAPPTLELPTTQPTVTATDTPAPTKTPKPANANLVVTGFELDDNYILVETSTPFIVTVKNVGTADAGPFSVAVLETNLVDGVTANADPKTVESGVRAGKSVRLSMDISVPKPGYWKLTATADSDDAIDESNEDDNTRDLNAKVLRGLPDLVWVDNGFTMTPSQTTAGDFEVGVHYRNKGTDDLAQTPAFVGITWYRDEDGASGDLDPFPIIDLEQGGEQTYSGTRHLPGPGSYTVYALLDRDHVLNELSSDNNETSVRVTVP